MTRRSDEELKPRNGHTLATSIVARISGCAKQKEVSLDDQVDHGKEEVADWFNQQGVPVGAYCRRKKWYGAMVRRYYHNPILKGQPGRGFRHTEKHHEEGRRVSVKNPKGPVFRECPHLAHLDPIEFDELNARLAAKNDKFCRKLVNGIDPLWPVFRKRTVFPGQHACCWYCGWHYVWGGNGVTENLMCSASRDWHCWNSFGFDGPLAVERIVRAITAELYQLDGFEDQFADMVRSAQRDRLGSTADDWGRLPPPQNDRAGDCRTLGHGRNACQ